MLERGKRLMFSLAGAALAAGLVAWVEARQAMAAEAHPPPFRDLFAAVLGVLLPLSTVVGLVVGLSCLFLEPSRARAPQEYLHALRTQPMLSRARTAALIPLSLLA